MHCFDGYILQDLTFHDFPDRRISWCTEMYVASIVNNFQVKFCTHEKLLEQLKPENIFLTQDKRGVKIGDFGFARTFSPNDVLATYVRQSL